MGSAVLEVGRTADIHELFFKLQNFQIWNVSNCKGVDLLIVRNVIFKLQNVQIKAVPARVSISSCSGIGFSRCETLKYMQCCPAMRLFC